MMNMNELMYEELEAVNGGMDTAEYSLGRRERRKPVPTEPVKPHITVDFSDVPMTVVGEIR